MARASASLRATWRWSWLSGGTSTTTSPSSRAWQPSRRPGASSRLAPVQLLWLAERRQVLGARLDGELGVRALAHDDLAAPADPAPAADRVEVDAQRPRRLEHAGAGGERASPARRGEDGTHLAPPLGTRPGRLGHGSCAVARRRPSRPPRRRPPAPSARSPGGAAPSR